VLGMLMGLLNCSWCPQDERGLIEPTWDPDFSFVPAP
jgi:hypothetical protein